MSTQPPPDGLESSATTTSDIPADRPRRSEPRRRRRTRSIAAILVVAAVLVALLAFFAWPRVSPMVGDLFGGPQDYAEQDATGRTTTVTVPEGATGGQIATVLADADVVASREAFLEVLEESPEASRIQAGTYAIQTRLPAQAALSALLDPANRSQISLTIPEGFAIWQVIDRVAAATGTPAEEVRAVAEDAEAIGLPAEAGGNAEGWFAAETYAFEPDDDVAAILSTMVDHTEQRLDELGVPPQDRQNVLTIASIVEREVAMPEYFGPVARVIANRLAGDGETYGLLQMDSTVLYGNGETGGIPTRAQIEDAANPYNTYQHPGLPPTPIGAPGELAIEAAMNPPEGPWLYFVTVDLDSGETKFAATLEEHQANIAELRAWRDAQG